LVYYYPATGRLTLEVERPSGAGQNSRILFDNSLLKLHSVNQFQSVSPVKLSTGWDLPQKHLFKVKLDADWQVAWLSDNANIDQDYLGLVNIPFRMTKIERYSKEDLAMINRRYSM